MTEQRLPILDRFIITFLFPNGVTIRLSLNRHEATNILNLAPVYTAIIYDANFVDPYS